MLSLRLICNHNITFIPKHCFAFCSGSILFLKNAFLAYALDPCSSAFLNRIWYEKYRRVLYDRKKHSFQSLFKS